MVGAAPRSTLFPYMTLFRSRGTARSPAGDDPAHVADFLAGGEPGPCRLGRAYVCLGDSARPAQGRALPGVPLPASPAALSLVALSLVAPSLVALALAASRP